MRYFKLTPVEEADYILGGVDVPVLPNADHEGFIAFVEMFKKDEYLNGQMQPDQIARLEAQARKHAQMIEALQAMAAQQANVQQMRSNAAMSAQQAPVGNVGSMPQGGGAPPAAQGA
jgi:hypothetical protein